MLLGPDRIDCVVHGALGHAHVDLERGWRIAVRSGNRGERSRRNFIPVGDGSGVRLNGRCGPPRQEHRSRPSHARYHYQADGSTTGNDAP